MKVRALTALTAALALTMGVAACGGSQEAGETGAPATGTSSTGSAAATAPLNAKLPEDIRAAGKLVVGSQLSSPPIIFLQDDGKTVDGVNKKLADELATELGVTVEFQQISFASLTPSLQSGKIDAIFDMMSDNAERQKTFDFVDFIHNGLTYLVKKDNPRKIGSAADLCGESVAGVRGTSLVTYAESASAQCTAAGHQPIEVLQFASASDARLQVQNGKCAAFLGQTPIMLYLAQNANNGNAFSTVVDDDYPTETIGIAVAKDDSALRDVLREAVQNLIASGRYRKILQEYGLAELGLAEATVNAGV